MITSRKSQSPELVLMNWLNWVTYNDSKYLNYKLYIQGSTSGQNLPVLELKNYIFMGSTSGQDLLDNTPVLEL